MHEGSRLPPLYRAYVVGVTTPVHTQAALRSVQPFVEFTVVTNRHTDRHIGLDYATSV